MGKVGQFILNAAFAIAIFAVLFGGATGAIIGVFWVAINLFGNNPLAVLVAIIFILSVACGVGFAISEATKS